MLKKTILYFLLIMIMSNNLMAQNDGRALLVNFNVGGAVAGGDLSDRFGNHSFAGLGLDYLTDKSFILGLEGEFVFGQEVKTDVLEGLRTEQGFVIANDRNPANIQLRERGIYVGAHLGKLFSIVKDNPRSGIRVTIGAGLLQHKIRIQDDPERVVAALSGNYRKGYDRLTNGLATREFIGYHHLSKNRLLNFKIGIELTQGFTKSRRDYNFDTMSTDTAKRLDLTYALKVGWTLPFYISTTAEDIFY